MIDNSKDPFKVISEKVKQLKPGQVLKLTNSFKPVPLIELLAKQGFENYVEHVDENCIITYFYKTLVNVGWVLANTAIHIHALFTVILSTCANYSKKCATKI